MDYKYVRPMLTIIRQHLWLQQGIFDLTFLFLNRLRVPWAIFSFSDGLEFVKKFMYRP